jgi:hypothetical protein
MVYALKKDYLSEARACWKIIEKHHGLELGDDEQIAGFLTLRGIIQEAEQNIAFYERLYLAPAHAPVESESKSEDEFHDALGWMEKNKNEDEKEMDGEGKAGGYSEPVGKKEEKEEAKERREAGGNSVPGKEKEERMEDEREHMKRGAGDDFDPNVIAKKHKAMTSIEE